MDIITDTANMLKDWDTCTIVSCAADHSIVGEVYYCIYDGEQQILSMVSGMYVKSSPQILIASADAISLKKGDSLTVRGHTYYIIGKTNDGHGLTTLILSDNHG